VVAARLPSPLAFAPWRGFNDTLSFTSRRLLDPPAVVAHDAADQATACRLRQIAMRGRSGIQVAFPR